ncbi:GMC oxidoreductase, partial [mine drainage metagenome]
TPAHLQIDLEQAPDRNNRLTLGQGKDACGRPVAIIHWRVTDVDHKRIADLTNLIFAQWNLRKASSGLPGLLPMPREFMKTVKLHDVYHPVGTTRLGIDREAVVDSNLGVRGVLNCSTLSTGLFPSAGSANPTLSLLCFAEVLKNRLRNLHRY